MWAGGREDRERREGEGKKEKRFFLLSCLLFPSLTQVSCGSSFGHREQLFIRESEL